MRNQEAIYKESMECALRAPIPAQTPSYSPVSHAEIVSAIEANASRNNLNITKRRVYTNNLGTRVVSFFDVEDGTEFGKEHGLKMMFGYRNSYDKSMSVAFVAGATVWICENGLISADMMAFRRKHTGDVSSELDQKIQIGVDRMKDEFSKILLEVDVMKNYSLTPRQKAEVLGVMYFEKNVVTPTQLSIVKHELKHSKHFKEDNAWSLYNNVTESLKKSHPVTIIRDHIKLHNFMRNTVGISPEIAEEELVEAVDAIPPPEAHVSGSTEG